MEVASSSQHRDAFPGSRTGAFLSCGLWWSCWPREFVSGDLAPVTTPHTPSVTPSRGVGYLIEYLPAVSFPTLQMCFCPTFSYVIRGLVECKAQDQESSYKSFATRGERRKNRLLKQQSRRSRRAYDSLPGSQNRQQPIRFTNEQPNSTLTSP